MYDILGWLKNSIDQNRESDHSEDYGSIFLVTLTESKIKPTFILGRVRAIHAQAFTWQTYQEHQISLAMEQ